MKLGILIGVACLVLLFLAVRFYKSARPGADAWQILIDQGALVVDVRSAQEFDQAHWKGARNIPLSILESKIDSLKQLQQALILCCASGARSARATRLLKDSGITVYDAGAWTNLP